MRSSIYLLTFSLLIAGNLFGQEDSVKPVLPFGLLQEQGLGCGSYDLMKCLDHQHEGYLRSADEFMEEVASSSSTQNQRNDIYEIPVVFHIVYNNDEENLPDSVIENQMEVLNSCFRRTNADAGNIRIDFVNYVGDARIEFKLAELDPDGLPTNGIVRTETDITHFGGILPYGPGDNLEITSWVNDSLFYNYFRLANPEMGGSEPWDPSRYLNIYVGDLRIFEPEFDDFEELVYFGIATPPMNHFNWPIDPFGGTSNFEDGVFMHYINIGNNNPTDYPAPYTIFNGVTNTGKMLVHEVGHYLGLRHIWGDGSCGVDDFIADTPNANAASDWDCNLEANSCTDDIDGVDLPNMIENYMDYSTASCQNSFTNGQIELMRSVLIDYRPELAEVFVGVDDVAVSGQMKLFPNPTNGQVNIELSDRQTITEIQIYNSFGSIVWVDEVSASNRLSLDLNLAPGMYVVQLREASGMIYSERLVVE